MTFSLDSGPRDAPVRLLLAHGAGAGIASPFFEKISELFAERGLATTRFEFGYMTARRTGQKRPPPRAETLKGEYLDFVDAVLKGKAKKQKLVIGGKSLGGRVASFVADELFVSKRISGLVCLGYPFHPPAKPDQLRTSHLLALQCPALIVQGERDPFGNLAEVEGYGLSKQIKCVWIGDGDHDFGPRGRSGYTRSGNLSVAADAVAEFAGQFATPR
jgi:uncharacterized protein